MQQNMLQKGKVRSQRCTKCNGTDAAPSLHPQAPGQLLPVGVYPCLTCSGWHPYCVMESSISPNQDEIQSKFARTGPESENEKKRKKKGRTTQFPNTGAHLHFRKIPKLLQYGVNISFSPIDVCCPGRYLGSYFKVVTVNLCFGTVRG